MATSDLPHEDDEARDAIADAYRDHLKHQPNSWRVNTLSTKPPFEPHCATFPIPNPTVPWCLSENDKRLLKKLIISPE